MVTTETNWVSPFRRNKLDLYVLLSTKLNLKCTQAQNRRPETMKPPEESIRTFVYAKHFVKEPPKHKRWMVKENVVCIYTVESIKEWASVFYSNRDGSREHFLNVINLAQDEKYCVISDTWSLKCWSQKKKRE